MSGLSKQLVRVLLRVAQSTEERFAAGKHLRAFSDGYRIGHPKGAALLFDQRDKARIGELLRAEGIDPTTPPDAWDGISRADATRLGPDEKFTSAPVKRRRVAIKTLPGRPLLLGGQQILLPSACHLDAEAPAVAGALAHQTLLLVENWECFERIHDVDLDLAPAGANPLVIWRGDTSATRTDQALALICALRRPTWAFVDFDPAGLLIAARLPGLAGIIAPAARHLERDLEQGLRERYEAQLHMAAAALDADQREPIRQLWSLLRRHGRALPQERYLRHGRDTSVIVEPSSTKTAQPD